MGVSTHLSGGQRGKAAGVEELSQSACWDLAAHPEQQREGGVNQVETSGLQAGSGAARRLLWVLGAVC